MIWLTKLLIDNFGEYSNISTPEIELRPVNSQYLKPVINISNV